MSITFLDAPVDITAWNVDFADVDVSAYVPADATGVLLHIFNNSTSDGSPYVRPKGSTSTDAWATKLGMQSSHAWGFVGLGPGRVFQIKSSGTPVSGCAYYLVGYTKSAFVFFQDHVEVSLPAGSSTWVDANVSSVVPAGAVAAIVGLRFITLTGGMRAKGSTDTRTSTVLSRPYKIPIGLDASRVFEVYKGNEGDRLFVFGYIVGGYTKILDATNVSLGSTGTYVDLPALPAGGKAGVYEVVSPSNRSYAFRTNGTSEDYYLGNQAWVHAICQADANGIVEGKISNVACDFYLTGYFTNYSSSSTGGSGGGLQRYANMVPVHGLIRR